MKYVSSETVISFNQHKTHYFLKSDLDKIIAHPVIPPARVILSQRNRLKDTLYVKVKILSKISGINDELKRDAVIEKNVR